MQEALGLVKYCISTIYNLQNESSKFSLTHFFISEIISVNNIIFFENCVIIFFINI